MKLEGKYNIHNGIRILLSYNLNISQICLIRRFIRYNDNIIHIIIKL